MNKRLPQPLFIISLLFYLIIPLRNSGQNLIPNPSFETHTNCPSGWSGGTNCSSTDYMCYAPPWKNPPSGNISADYYNACSTGTAGVPANWTGIQLARTGDAYAGIYCYQTLGALSSYIREYFQAPLPAALIAGRTYTVSFYVTLADDAGFAVDGLGALFTVGAPRHTTGNFLANDPYVPQIQSPDGVPIDDKLNWVEVKGSFVAAGGENYITIGDFKTDVELTVKPVGGAGYTVNSAYYFIDDVCMVEGTGPCTLAVLLEMLTTELEESKSGVNIQIKVNPDFPLSYFKIEKSENGFEFKEWKIIYPFSPGFGNVSDTEPLDNQFYKISLVSTNGETSFGKVLKRNQSIKSYWDARNKTLFSSQTGLLEVYNSEGLRIKSIPLSEQINLSFLNPGFYILRTNQNYSQKIVIY